MKNYYQAPSGLYLPTETETEAEIYPMNDREKLFLTILQAEADEDEDIAAVEIVDELGSRIYYYEYDSEGNQDHMNMMHNPLPD